MSVEHCFNSVQVILLLLDRNFDPVHVGLLTCLEDDLLFGHRMLEYLERGGQKVRHFCLLVVGLVVPVEPMVDSLLSDDKVDLLRLH